MKKATIYCTLAALAGFAVFLLLQHQAEQKKEAKEAAAEAAYWAKQKQDSLDIIYNGQLREALLKSK